MTITPEIADIYRKKTDTAARAGHPSACHWNVTFRCNASCSYCFARTNIHHDLDITAMMTIADKLFSAGVLSLSISGGEPFIRKDILSILEYVIEKNFFWISILTNGSLISDQHLSFLTSHAKYFNAVRMSVFSLDKKLNDSIFGVKESLDKTIAVGTSLIDAGIRVAVSINPVPETASEIRDIHAFFKGKGFIPTIGLKRLTSNANRDEVNPERYGYNFFRECLNALPEKNLYDFLTHMERCLNGDFNAKSLCSGIRKEITVNPDGTVYPCQLLKNCPVGNLLEERSLTDMLLGSERYLRIRNTQATDLRQCADCKFFYFCNLCIGERDLDQDDLYKPRTMTCEFARAVYDHYRESA